jgi:hypothetical protein
MARPTETGSCIINLSEKIEWPTGRASTPTDRAYIRLLSAVGMFDRVPVTVREIKRLLGDVALTNKEMHRKLDQLEARNLLAYKNIPHGKYTSLEITLGDTREARKAQARIKKDLKAKEDDDDTPGKLLAYFNRELARRSDGELTGQATARHYAKAEALYERCSDVDRIKNAIDKYLGVSDTQRNGRLDFYHFESTFEKWDTWVREDENQRRAEEREKNAPVRTGDYYRERQKQHLAKTLVKSPVGFSASAAYKSRPK